MKTATSMIGHSIIRFCSWGQYLPQSVMVILYQKVEQAKAVAFCSQYSQEQVFAFSRVLVSDSR